MENSKIEPARAKTQGYFKTKCPSGHLYPCPKVRSFRPRGIKAIIFDLGNVLIDFDHRIAAKKLSKLTDKTGEEIYNLFFDSPATHDFESGKISPESFFSKVKATLNLNMSYNEFVPVWNEIFFFSEKNLQVFNIASELKKRYRMALLSNINVLHFEYIKETFPVLEAFHNIVVSFEAHSIKPEPEIYGKTLDILGTSAEETFYTDDRKELVESAVALGIKSFQFIGALDLKNDLKSCGINLGELGYEG